MLFPEPYHRSFHSGSTVAASSVARAMKFLPDHDAQKSLPQLQQSLNPTSSLQHRYLFEPITVSFDGRLNPLHPQNMNFEIHIRGMAPLQTSFSQGAKLLLSHTEGLGRRFQFIPPKIVRFRHPQQIPSIYASQLLRRQNSSYHGRPWPLLSKLHKIFTHPKVMVHRHPTPSCRKNSSHTFSRL